MYVCVRVRACMCARRRQPTPGIISQKLSPKIHQGVNTSQFSYLEILTAMPYSGNFPDSVEAVKIN